MPKIAKEFLNTIANECKKVKVVNNYAGLEELRAKLLKDYNLRHIGTGVSRYVFKTPYSREVLKFDPSKTYNISEYCVSKGMEGSNIGKLFAPCNEISDNCTIITQQYLPIRLKEYSFDIDAAWEYASLRDALEKCFDFLKKWKMNILPICDFHEDNIRLSRGLEAKIIDYASMIYPYPITNNFSIASCINSLRRYTKKHDQEVSLYVDQERSLVLKTNSGIYTTSNLKGLETNGH